MQEEMKDKLHDLTNDFTLTITNLIADKADALNNDGFDAKFIVDFILNSLVFITSTTLTAVDKPLYALSIYKDHLSDVLLNRLADKKQVMQ